MSGHSKWATIKHKKGAADKKRGKLFAKLIRQVEVAARSGGGDPESNPTLRTMFQKARDASVPLDTIERAIKRGTGELEGVTYEAVTYEGYAPGGVAVFVEALTDNRNRTGAEIRSTFTKLGGSLAEPGAVGWQFERRGVVVVPGSVDEDDLVLAALDAGADDVNRVEAPDEDPEWHVMCEATSTALVRQAVEDAGITVVSSDLTMVATTTVSLDSAEAAKPVLRLIDALDDHDDVQDVYANLDVPDEVLAVIES
jgi:YebC/PmpR family DNA-binding regulatory protein